MKTLFIFFLSIALLILLPKGLSAEDFSHIDSLSIQTPYETTHSINELVSYCENHATTELARVRFYFVWVATHISYDETIDFGKQNPNAVFESRKAVCSGYSKLLSHLCEQSGIAVRYVAGYGKVLDETLEIQNHAWNIIRIDGKWYPFDVTWAANELSDDEINPLSKAFEEWFMSPTDVFQATHLPFDPVCQLSNLLVVRNYFLYPEALQSSDTEGGAILISDIKFTEILNEESSIDSLERVCRSYKRAYAFMPSDSAVAIKLVKAQEAIVTREFESVYQFRKNDYRNIPSMSTDQLKTWLKKLQYRCIPLENALCLHDELAFFQLLEANKRTLKQNHQFFQDLLVFTKKAVSEISAEINSRESIGFQASK